MSRAQVKLDANERITIDGKSYRVTEHPALPGIPYVQRGARGFVIQLAAPDGERMALKYFKLKYRVPELVKVAASLRKYADLPGLKAARRTIFTRDSHAGLIGQYPALEYGMLMPWLPGMTWYDLVTSKAPITASESLSLAQATADVLGALEANHLAHTDIAGANVMVDRRSSGVQLVDIEELYGPEQPPPVESPAGQDGYQHKQGREQGQWLAEGDRFAAAILLAEMLGWSDARLRQNSADEHYFSSAEMQDPDSARFRLMSASLRERYTEALASLFEQAWRSTALAECPPLRLWREALAETVKTVNPAEIKPSISPATYSPVVSGRRTIGNLPAPTPPAASPPPDLPAATNTPALPLPTAAPGPVQTPLPQVQLDGVKLCRNCGAENPSSYTFCKRCGYFVGTFDQRRPIVSNLNNLKRAAANAASAASTGIPSPPGGSAAPPPPVTVKQDRDSIIVARRVGDPGKGLQRVETPPKPTEEQIQTTTGSWLVAAIIVFMALTALVLVVMGGGR